MQTYYGHNTATLCVINKPSTLQMNVLLAQAEPVL